MWPPKSPDFNPNSSSCSGIGSSSIMSSECCDRRLLSKIQLSDRLRGGEQDDNHHDSYSGINSGDFHLRLDHVHASRHGEWVQLEPYMEWLQEWLWFPRLGGLLDGTGAAASSDDIGQLPTAHGMAGGGHWLLVFGRILGLLHWRRGGKVHTACQRLRARRWR